MLSGVQTGNGTPYDKYNIRGIARALKQKRRHFHAKTTSAKLYIYIGVRSRDLFIDEAHMALGIFPVSFPCMLPTPLCGIFYLCTTFPGREEWLGSQSLAILVSVCTEHEHGLSKPQLDLGYYIFIWNLRTTWARISSNITWVSVHIIYLLSRKFAFLAPRNMVKPAPEKHF